MGKILLKCICHTILKELWLEVMLTIGFQMWCYNQNKHPKQINKTKLILGFVLTLELSLIVYFEKCKHRVFPQE